LIFLYKSTNTDAEGVAAEDEDKPIFIRALNMQAARLPNVVVEVKV
jgi:hypothetical protein